MLWNIIRDFIVEHITGGSIYNLDTGEIAYYGGIIGYDANYGGACDTSNTIINTGLKFDDGQPLQLLFGDWLATTLTIIAMCLIVAFAVWLVRWVFKAVSSAFLLKR